MVGSWCGGCNVWVMRGWLFPVMLASVLSARATMVQIPVAPTNLVQGDYTFAISNSVVSNGIAFHVTVTSKLEPILPDCGLTVGIVRQTTNSFSSEFAQPVIPVKLKKGERVWEADFVVSQKLPPDLCVLFSTLGHITVNGKLEAMPSVTLYIMRLREFVDK